MLATLGALAVPAIINGLVDKLVVPATEKLCVSTSRSLKELLIPKRQHFEEYYTRMYNDLSVMNTLAFRNQQLQLRNLYTPLTLEAEGSVQLSMTVDKYHKDIIDRFKRILINDTAGMGKSTLAKFLFLDIVDNGIGIPIFIELRKISKKLTLLDEITRELGGLKENFDKDLLLNLFAGGDFIFIFDGFDEIALNNRDAVVDDIKKFVSCLKDNTFIITSRPESMLTAFGDFQAFKIIPLKEHEAYSLLKKYDKNGELSSNLIEELKKQRNSPITEFLKNPLLVSLMFVVYNYKTQIPLKKHLFYSQVYEAIFESHDLTKGGNMIHEKRCGLDIDDFEKILRYMGFISFRRGKVEFSRDEIIKLINDAGKRWSAISLKDSAFLEDLVTSVPLFCKDGLNYRWAHKSLSEYFAAKFIFYDLKDLQKEQLKRLYESDNLEKYINLLDLYHDMDLSTFEECILTPLFSEYNEYLMSLDHDSPDFFIRNLLFLKDLELLLFNGKTTTESLHDFIIQRNGSVLMLRYLDVNERLLIGDSAGRNKHGKRLLLAMLYSKNYPYIKIYRPHQYKFSSLGSIEHHKWINIDEIINSMNDNMEILGDLCEMSVGGDSASRVYIEHNDIKKELDRMSRNYMCSDLLI